MINQGIAPVGYFSNEYANRDWEFYSPIISKIVQYSRPGPILDIGAGCGYLIEAAIKWGLQCTGVEGSQDGIDVAKKRNIDIELVRHNLSDPLPFANDSFQTVVLNQVIEHLEPKVAANALSEAFRVLRKDGMILIFSPSKANLYEWNADPTHINQLSPTELRDALFEHGFSDIIELNTPRYLLGTSWVGVRVMFVLFKLLRLDILSATANAFAYKKL